MYKIGDKVETPYGIGKITYISEYITQKGFHIQLKNGNVEFTANHLKPYTSAHDKLIVLGYEKTVNKTTVDYIKETKDTYRRYGNRITIHLKEKLYSGISFNDDLFNSQYHTSEMAFSLKLSRILTQYLEELE